MKFFLTIGLTLEVLFFCAGCQSGGTTAASEFPSSSADDPMATWNTFQTRINNEDIEGALTQIVSWNRDSRRREFTKIGVAQLKSFVADFGPLTLMTINDHEADYRFDIADPAGGYATFYAIFIRENGQWKIVEF